MAFCNVHWRPITLYCFQGLHLLLIGKRRTPAEDIEGDATQALKATETMKFVLSLPNTEFWIGALEVKHR